MSAEKRIYRNVPYGKLSSISMKDPADGFPVAVEKGKTPSEIYLPADYYEKKEITEEEIQKLKETMEAAKTIKQLINSELFAKEYIKIKVNW